MDFDEVKCSIEKFFNGKFEVKKFLGEGSFAKVYLVNHNYLDTLMAMKIVKEPLSITTNKKSVFREVTLACQLRHENIISIFDAAEITDFEDGLNHAYFVMEYVSGGDLEQFLNSFIENGLFMSVERSLDLIRQILRGLNTLHSANPPIIHRDLKLNNVLLSFSSNGDVIIKLSDFGFAKEVTKSISDIDIAGTRPYMAPEIFKKDVSTKSDIYAVGVMIYQLLTNRYPYDVEKYANEELINLKPWMEKLKPPSHYNKNVFRDLDEIVLKCLEFDSSKRYNDAGELLEEVEKVIDNYKSSQIIPRPNPEEYWDDNLEYVVNDSILKAFELAKCENKLSYAIEILEREVLRDYNVRKCYSETLKIWKSERPDLKLISNAFSVNLNAKNYKLSCNMLKEAISYNPSLKGKYQHYIDLWNIFIDLKSHRSLFKSVAMLEKLMDSSPEIGNIYRNIIPTLKTYSIEEIVVEAIRLVNLNNLSDGANLMEFAVVCDAHIREKYAYKLSLWKQNMRMHFKRPNEIKDDAIDYAIDLGTTDSVLSFYNNGNPVVIKNHMTGEDFTPSAVLIDDKNNIHVGVDARDAIFENSRNAVSEFKNNMGFSVPFKFDKSSRVMFPEELSAEVLKHLRTSAYNNNGVTIEHAVICVPANSNPIKTRAIIEAADLAGFRSIHLIPEPIAVSLAYDLKKDRGIWMVYDLGGATFNVSLIRERDGEIEKLLSKGLENFGGNAFDWKIVNDVFKPKIAFDLNLDDFRQDNPKYLKVFARLKNASEVAKKDLTKHGSADIFLHNLFDGYDFKFTLTRESLKEITAPLIKYTFELCRDLLNDASLDEADIDKIILVGGSSLSPIIKESIADEFDIEMESSINPLTVVAKGAAIYAGSIEKPQCTIKKHPVSILFNRDNGIIKGRAFTKDLKSSFLGFSIEFKSKTDSIKIPLNIDGTFNLALNDLKYDIAFYEGDDLVNLDDKSPDSIESQYIFIPFFKRDFKLKNDLDYYDLSEEYSNLLKEIDCILEYSIFDDKGLLAYVEKLLEIARRDETALNQAEIYIDYLASLVEDSKRELEFSILLENVSKKIDAIKEKDLFEIENYEKILEKGNLDDLKDLHADLIEKYVLLNRNDVIQECYFNLKLEGIYSSNQHLAYGLFEKGQMALRKKDYDELFNIVNLLYELDERKSNNFLT